MSSKGRIDELFDLRSIEGQQEKAIQLVEQFIAEVGKANQSKIALKAATNPSDIIAGIEKVSVAQKKQNDIVIESVEVQKKLSKAIADQAAASDKAAKSNTKNAQTLDAVDKAKQKLAVSESKLTKEAALYNVQASQQNRLNQINATLLAAVPGSLEEAAAKVAKYRYELSVLNVTTEAGKKKQTELIAEIDKQNNFIDKNSDALARQKINIGNYESAINGLGRAVRGLGGLSRTLGAAIGLDPIIGETIHTIGNSLIELSHALALEKIAKGEAAGATVAYTVAQADSTLTTEAATAATITQSGALEGEAVAAETAAKSTGIFNKALKLISDNPVIFVLLALVTVIGAVVAALSSQGDAFTKVSKAAKAYSDAVRDTVEINEEATDFSNKNLKDQKKLLEDQLARETALGITKERRLALERRIADVQNEINNNQLKANPDINKKLEEQNAIYGNALLLQKQIAAFREKIAKEGLEKALAGTDKKFLGGFFGGVIDDKDIDKALKKIEDTNKATLESAKSTRDKLKGIQDDVNDNQQVYLRLLLETDKLSAEDRIKVSLAEAQIEADAVQNKNNRILANEHSTHAQRLAAMQSNAEALKKRAIADEAAVEQTPGVEPADVIVAQQQLNAKLKEIDLDSNAEQIKETEAFNRRMLELTHELEQQQIIEKIEANKEILDNDNASFSARLDAAQGFYNASLDQLTKQRDFELEQSKSLPEEEGNKKRLAIIQKFNSDVLKLNRESAKQVEDLAKKHIETLSNIRKSTEDTAISDIQNQYNEELAIENQQYLIKVQRDKGNAVRLEQDRIDHEKRIQEIQFESLKKQLEQEITFAESELAIEKARVQAEPDSDKKRQDMANIAKGESVLAALRIKLINLVADHNLKSNEADEKSWQSLLDKKIEALQKFAAYTKEVFDIVGSFIDASVTKQLNGIQDEIDLLDKKKAKDIEVAEQTIANAQDRAAAITVIEARAAAQEDLLNIKKRQAQERQARFEKAANIATLIQETAIAVVRALGDKSLPGPLRIAEATVIGALGIARIAAAVATPIPRYGQGTDNHPGGLAEVGHGRPEAVVLPSGKVIKTPATPTVMSLPKGTVVHPDYDKMMIAATLTRVPEFSQRSVNDTAERAMLKVGKDIVGAIKGKKETHLYMPGRYEMYMREGSKFRAYLKDNL